MFKLDEEWELHALIGEGWGEGLVLWLKRDPFEVHCIDLPTFIKVVRNHNI